MSLPRATVVDYTRNQGKDEAEIIVRAGSKAGAMMTARLEAFKTIPFREQEVSYVRQMDSDRLMNKWRVRVTDQESMASVGE